MRVLHSYVNYINQYLPVTNHWLILFSSIPVALSTGTLFVYSIYSTQLIDKCDLNTSDSANLSISATLGTAIGAILGGFVTDHYGTQLPMLISCISISIGYYWVYYQYELGKHSNIFALLTAMFLVGIGSVSGYFSALKAVTVNFPNLKSTAQSITIASFAISSLIYSFIFSNWFHSDIPGFLRFLSLSSGIMIFIGFVFIRVDGHLDHEDIIENPNEVTGLLNTPETLLAHVDDLENPHHDIVTDELQNLDLKDTLTHSIFWYHYIIFAIVQGLGQMYIYSIGFILKAIHYYFEHELDQDKIPSLSHLQAIHVSIIAVTSFLGRLSSGPISDFMVYKLNSQRHWVLIIGLSCMFLAHFMYSIDIRLISLEFIHVRIFLVVLSSMIGFAYGFSFTSYPAIVSDIFNMKNYSVIWGTTYSATTLGLILMTKIFGFIYDKNTTSYDKKLKDYVCAKGSGCYNETFYITSSFCLIAIILVFGYIFVHRKR
ncbi:unnamed protein product [Candida verbasci]|uniref:Nodulin-like domain-containing protein n=1 Tax=Candida verbasci TaxID=1227364 RepID=A0A9W4TUC1_9ASCO|nr:unnamed protein product [Candida verbasci]